MSLIICELNLPDRLMYESLFVEMGCVLKFSQLISVKNHFETQLRDALHALENHNRHLSSLSQTDELTDLYNRRGFLNVAGRDFPPPSGATRAGCSFTPTLTALKSSTTPTAIRRAISPSRRR